MPTCRGTTRAAKRREQRAVRHLHYVVSDVHRAFWLNELYRAVGDTRAVHTAVGVAVARQR